MRLKWYGHSCFKLDFSQGPYVVADPFDETVGYPVCRESCDIVTTSHAHGDHNYLETLQGDYTRLNRPGLFSFDDLTVQGVKSYHDEENGAFRGENVIFIFESDDLRIAHLGDLGHEPTLRQYAMLNNIDVLLIPIGGYFTIDTPMALKIIDHINPKLTIPMHFKTDVMNYPISDEKAFAEATGATYWDKNYIDLTKEGLKSLPKTIVLRYKD